MADKAPKLGRSGAHKVAVVGAEDEGGSRVVLGPLLQCVGKPQHVIPASEGSFAHCG